jgi:hypothetical protein
MIYEFWGEYDLDGTGVPKQIVCVWVDKLDIVLQLEENFLPGKRIPFVSTPYSSVPFSLWGNALAYFAMDNQKVRSMIMRGILDNMSLSNNGQKFIQKGTLDYVNWKRLTSGGKYIQVNKLDGMVDGSFNELPQSVYNLFGLIQEETDALTGISKMAQGLDPGAMANTAAGVQTMASITQKRLMDVVRNVSNLLTKIFVRWNDYNKLFLDEIEINTYLGSQRFTAQDLKGDYDITINVATDVNKQTKIQQYNLMLQQSNAMSGSIPPELMNVIYAKMLDLFDEPAMAEMVRTYKPQPDPMQQQMQQLEMSKLAAEVQDTQASAMYKQTNAQENIKKLEHMDAEIDSMDMETTLKPQQALADFFQKTMPPQNQGGQQK